METQIKGPGLFLAQFAGADSPFNSLSEIVGWAAGLGYNGVQIPTFDARLFDLDTAANSQTYCDDVKGICHDAGVEITELSTHLQGQLVAVNPVYDEAFDAFAPAHLHGKPAARKDWAIDQMMKAAIASERLGLSHTVSFTGSLATTPHRTGGRSIRRIGSPLDPNLEPLPGPRAGHRVRNSPR